MIYLEETHFHDLLKEKLATYEIIEISMHVFIR